MRIRAASFFRLAIACVVATGAAGRARGDVIFSSFGPGDSFDASSPGYGVVGGTPPLPSISYGFQFTAAAGGTLTEVDVAVTRVTGAFDLLLYADDGSGQLGGLLASFPNLAGASTPGVVAATAGSGPALVAGQGYWLVMAASTPTSSYAWLLNDRGLTGPGELTLGGPPPIYLDGQPLPAFRLLGGVRAVPEPSSLVLLGAGGLGLLALARHGARAIAS